MKSLFFGFGPVAPQAVALTKTQTFDQRVRFLARIYNVSPDDVRISLRRAVQRRLAASSA